MGDQIIMGPLTRVVPVSEFEAWIGSAATGAQIAYADGLAAPRATATFHLAREMSDAGYVDLFTRKVDGRTEWLARRKRPVEVAVAARPPVEPVSDDGDDARLLNWLRRCANMRMPAPTNAEIANAYNLRNPSAASYLMRKLREAGAITWVDDGPAWRRSVTIVATGRSTPKAAI